MIWGILLNWASVKWPVRCPFNQLSVNKKWKKSASDIKLSMFNNTKNKHIFYVSHQLFNDSRLPSQVSLASGLKKAPMEAWRSVRRHVSHRSHTLRSSPPLHTLPVTLCVFKQSNKKTQANHKESPGSMWSIAPGRYELCRLLNPPLG